MRGDLNLLYLGAQVLEASIDEMRLVGVTDIVGEFEKALLRELDFREELGNLLRMRGQLDPERKVTVPQPYPELSDKTVLTMEFFAGKPLRSARARQRARPARGRRDSCTRVQAGVRGRLLSRRSRTRATSCATSEGTLCLLDLGLVGKLTEEQRADVVTLLVATFANDSASIARILLKMGTPTQRVNLIELHGEIERIRGKYLEATAGSASSTRRASCRSSPTPRSASASSWPASTPS